MVQRVGPITDPDARRERAKIARAAQTTVDHHIRKLVDAWPQLTAGQRDRLAVLLRDAPADEQAGGGRDAA